MTKLEIDQALAAGCDVEDYGHARGKGASHDEALAAHAVGCNVWHYGDARGKGAGHTEAIAESKK